VIGFLYVNAELAVTVPESEFVMTRFADPYAELRVEQVIEVDETTVTESQAVPPIETVAPLANAVPVIVTRVPPVVGPDDGLIPEMVGEV
jgi:hypothetical protein